MNDRVTSVVLDVRRSVLRPTSPTDADTVREGDAVMRAVPLPYLRTLRPEPRSTHHGPSPGGGFRAVLFFALGIAFAFMVLR